MVAAVGVRPAGAEGTAVPGFVDVHINGVAGVDFLSADVAGLRRAARAQAGAGVVAFQPTLVSSRADDYREPLAAAAEAAALTDGLPLVTGVHLEGPFLSPHWPGAHDLAHLRVDPRLARRLRPRAGAHDDPGARAARGNRADPFPARRGGGRLVRSFGRGRAPGPRRLRRRGRSSDPSAQRAPALPGAGPRARRRGARARRRDCAGDRGRRAPRPESAYGAFLAAGPASAW